MSEKEIGSQISTNEQLNEAECRVAHDVCQEARDLLDREICLQNLVEQLGIECTEQEKALLIPALIERRVKKEYDALLGRGTE
jgi:hypothetical protein